MTYKEIDDPDFVNSLKSKKEFNKNKFSSTTNSKQKQGLAPQQKLLRNYISPYTPYNNLLIFHSTGVGKTGTAIIIAEQFKNYVLDSKTKIIILVKNETIAKNFKLELTKNIFTYENYATNQMRKKLFDTTKVNQDVKYDEIVKSTKRKKILSDISRKISKYYKFLTYDSFVNRIIGIKKTGNKENERKVHKDEIKDISNSIIIVDEAHNLIGNERQKALQIALDNSVATRLILLSATPAFDNPRQMIEILNLLQDDKKDRATEKDKRKFFKSKSKTRTNQLGIETSIENLTKEGKDFVKKASKGVVSYLKVDKQNFPEKIFQGVNLVNNDEFSLKVVPCEMSSIQYQGYLKAMEKELYSKSKEGTSSRESDRNNNQLGYREMSLASTFVFGDEEKVYYGKEAFKKAFGKEEDKGKKFSMVERNKMLNGDNLKYFSCKIHRLIQDIKNSKGTCFVFTELVNEAGVELLKNLFKMNGVEKFKTLSGDTSPEDREKIRLKFINPVNKDGKNIKVLIATSVFAEGITLKNVRNVFLIEPPWNMSRIDQVIGRAVRNGSHNDLPPEDRYVNIYLYCSILPKNEREDSEKSIDMLKYKVCYQKDRGIKEMERLIKKNAFDCSFNKERNLVKGEKDGSRECDYQECDYKCSSGKGGSGGSSETVETTETWMFHLNSNDMNEIKKQIKKIFRDSENMNVMFSFEDIYNELIRETNQGVDRDLLAYTLDQMLSNQESFRDKNGNFDLYLIQRKDKYLLQHFDRSQKESIQDRKDHIIKGYNKDKDIYGNIQTFLKKSPDKFSAKKLSNKSKEKSNSNKNNELLDTTKKQVQDIVSNKYKIYGNMYNRIGKYDGKFRIVDNRTLKDDTNNDDKRKFLSGQVCSTIKIENLQDIYKYLLSISSIDKTEKEKEFVKDLSKVLTLKKKDLCNPIKNLLQRNKLILD